MISCRSLGPMVTGEIWRAGSLCNGWPHGDCQAGISSTASMFLSSCSVPELCSFSHILTNNVSTNISAVTSVTHFIRKWSSFVKSEGLSLELPCTEQRCCRATRNTPRACQLADASSCSVKAQPHLWSRQKISWEISSLVKSLSDTLIWVTV